MFPISMAEKNCIFCKIVNGEIPAEKIAETKNFIAFLDANPKTKGHFLIVPKDHYEALLELPENLGNELLEFIKKTAKEQLKKVDAEGFNLVLNNHEVAGQVVKHVHFHIIPRKKSDNVVNLKV